VLFSGDLGADSEEVEINKVVDNFISFPTATHLHFLVGYRRSYGVLKIDVQIGLFCLSVLCSSRSVRFF
jgi:hypothetical protein